MAPTSADPPPSTAGADGRRGARSRSASASLARSLSRGAKSLSRGGDHRGGRGGRRGRGRRSRSRSWQRSGKTWKGDGPNARTHSSQQSQQQHHGSWKGRRDDSRARETHGSGGWKGRSGVENKGKGKSHSSAVRRGPSFNSGGYEQDEGGWQDGGRSSWQSQSSYEQRRHSSWSGRSPSPASGKGPRLSFSSGVLSRRGERSFDSAREDGFRKEFNSSGRSYREGTESSTAAPEFSSGGNSSSKGFSKGWKGKGGGVGGKDWRSDKGGKKGEKGERKGEKGEKGDRKSWGDKGSSDKGAGKGEKGGDNSKALILKSESVEGGAAAAQPPAGFPPPPVHPATDGSAPPAIGYYPMPLPGFPPPPGYPPYEFDAYHAATLGGQAAALPPDFASQRPEAFSAFLHYLSSGYDGTVVTLSDGLCRDDHVGDLLSCLESWLNRTYGPPATTGQPWRIGKLDLSRNTLSDANCASVLDRLKELDVRVRRLIFDGNSGSNESMRALTEYVWNCSEVVMEIGLADNQISVKASDVGDDPVSTLLRCLYNSAVYPWKASPNESIGNTWQQCQVWPLLLRLGGNFIENGQELLNKIVERGGRDHVLFCDSANSFPSSGKGQEYLAVYMPGFESQRSAPAATVALAIKEQPRSPSRGSDYYSYSGSYSEESGVGQRMAQPVLPREEAGPNSKKSKKSKRRSHSEGSGHEPKAKKVRRVRPKRRRRKARTKDDRIERGEHASPDQEQDDRQASEKDVSPPVEEARRVIATASKAGSKAIPPAPRVKEAPEAAEKEAEAVAEAASEPDDANEEGSNGDDQEEADSDSEKTKKKKAKKKKKTKKGKKKKKKRSYASSENEGHEDESADETTNQDQNDKATKADDDDDDSQNERDDKNNKNSSSNGSPLEQEQEQEQDQQEDDSDDDPVVEEFDDMEMDDPASAEGSSPKEGMMARPTKLRSPPRPFAATLLSKKREQLLQEEKEMKEKQKQKEMREKEKRKTADGATAAATTASAAASGLAAGAVSSPQSDLNGSSGSKATAEEDDDEEVPTESGDDEPELSKKEGSTTVSKNSSMDTGKGKRLDNGIATKAKTSNTGNNLSDTEATPRATKIEPAPLNLRGSDGEEAEDHMKETKKKKSGEDSKKAKTQRRRRTSKDDDDDEKSMGKSNLEDSAHDSFGEIASPHVILTAEERSNLLEVVSKKLSKHAGSLSSSDLAELSKDVVCMLETQVKPSEMLEQDKLKSCLRHHMEDFVAWLRKYLQGPWTEKRKRR